MNIRLGRLASCVTLATVVTTLLTTPLAHAAPPTTTPPSISAKQAEARRLQDQIEANGERVDALNERVNGATLRRDQAQASILEAQRRIEETQAHSDAIKRELAGRAAALYIGAGSSALLGGLSTNDAQDFEKRETYSGAAASKDNELIDELTRTREQLDAQQTQFQQAKDAAQSETESLTAAKRQVQELDRKQQALLAQTKGELATLVAQEQRRRDEEGRRQAQAAQAQREAARRNATTGGSSTKGAGADTPLPNVPAPSPAAAKAVAFARAQLGKPYRYAGTGPDAYDCSGLTMAAWAAAGVSLPHFSGAQYQMLPKVALSQLAPGDLVFRGASGSAHVAIYVGDGMVITAPQTGDVVKLAGMGRVLPQGGRPGV